MPPGLDIAFAGTPELAARVLEILLDDGTHKISLVYTRPDRPAGRGRRLHQSPVKQLAEAGRIPVLQPRGKLEIDPDHRLAKLDVMVVAAFGMIIPEDVLNRPRFGCINTHTSLLPRWRGAAPIQRAVLAGDTETGITIMQMDAGLDTGDILYQESCPIRADDTAGSLHDTLAGMAGRCILTVLEKLTTGSLTPIPQPDTGATYADKIKKHEALIDWSRPAAEIDRLIRAFNPAPVAYTVLEGVTLRIWQAEIRADSADKAPPGTIVGYSSAGLDIATGDRIIKVLKLQLPGKKILDCRDFFNGNPHLWR